MMGVWGWRGGREGGKKRGELGEGIVLLIVFPIKGL